MTAKVLCPSDPCPMILNSKCVFYEGVSLLNSNINTNDNLQTSLQKLDALIGEIIGEQVIVSPQKLLGRYSLVQGVKQEISLGDGFVLDSVTGMLSFTGYEPAFEKNTAFNRNFGSSADTVCEGNDPRLSDARPASDVYSWAKELTKPFYTTTEITEGTNLYYTDLRVTNNPAVVANTAKISFPGFGTSHSTAAYGDHLHTGTYLTEETDPVFSLWDKSTGIIITKSQVSDFGTYEAPLTFSTGLNRTGNTITNTITQYTDLLAKTAVASTGTGFIKSNGSVLSVDDSTYLTGTKVDSFNTRTGTVSLTKADVEGVLTGLISTHTHNYQAPLNGIGFVKISGTTISYDNSTYLTSLSGAVLTDQTISQTIGDTTNRLSKLWATDITCTNTISGSITGNAGTVTNGVYTTDTATVTNVMLAGSIANSKLANSTISGISLGSNLNTLTIGTGLSGGSYNGSSPVTIACTVTQYTDALARQAISETITGIDYNNSTGVFSLTSGYTIPTTTDFNNKLTVSLSSPLVDQIIKYNGSGWVNGNETTVNAGSGVDYFYVETASDITGYSQLNKSPDAGGELDESVVANNNRVLINEYASPSSGLGGTKIDSGIWTFDIWAYVDVSLVGSSSIDIDVLKRTSGGTETLLFNVNSGSLLTSLGTEPNVVSTVQGEFAINSTDRLVIKVYGKNTASNNRTIHFFHGGTSHYSHINTPLVIRHNDLSGLEGGTWHLTQPQYTIATQAATSLLSGYLTFTDWNTFNNKQNALVSGTNIKTINSNSLLGSGDISVAALIGYTPYNATNPSSYIALTDLSSTATGLTYTNTTGVFSLTSGYVIPTATQAANWQTAYDRGAYPTSLPTPYSVTFNNSGAGDASGTSFNGSSAKTISYNTIGAQVAGSYEPANSNIQSHISNTSNPHSVTKAQVGLSNVADVLQWYSGNHPTTTAGYGLPDYPTTLPASDVYSWAKATTKPSYTAGEVGAEPAFSKNTAFNKNFGTATGQVWGYDAHPTTTGGYGLPDYPTSLPPTSGSTYYIQNQNSSPQSANSWITGAFRSGYGHALYDGTTSLGGFFPYKNVYGSGSDVSLGIFSENDIWFAPAGSATKRLIVNGSGITVEGTISATGGNFSGEIKIESNNARLRLQRLGTNYIDFNNGYNLVFRSINNTDGDAINAVTFNPDGTISTASHGTSANWYSAYTGLNASGLTTNYLPKWNGSSLVNSLISDDGTDVRIKKDNASFIISRANGGYGLRILQEMPAGTINYQTKLADNATWQTYMQVGEGQASTLSSLILQPTAGSVFVGYTSDPTSGNKFAVNGNALFGGNSVKVVLNGLDGTSILRWADNGTEVSQVAVSGGNTYFDYVGDIAFRSGINGNVRYTLTSAGNATFGGSVTATGAIQCNSNINSGTGNNNAMLSSGNLLYYNAAASNKYIQLADDGGTINAIQFFKNGSVSEITLPTGGLTATGAITAPSATFGGTSGSYGQLINVQSSDATTPFWKGIVNKAHDNSSYLAMFYDGSIFNIGASYGTSTDGGAYKPIGIFTSDTERIHIAVNGNIDLKSNTDITGNLTTTGAITAPNFISNVATGTQPYATTSTTLNTNLNADYLDGKHASDLIYNQNDSAQTANLWISGTMKADLGGFNSLRSLKNVHGLYTDSATSVIDKFKSEVFNFKTKPDTDTTIGFIVDEIPEEVQKYVLIGEKKDAVNFYSLIGISYKAIQELTSENKELKKRVAALEKRLNS